MGKNLISLFLILVLFVCALCIACAPVEPDGSAVDTSSSSVSSQSSGVQEENSSTASLSSSVTLPSNTESTASIPTESSVVGAESTLSTSPLPTENSTKPTASIPTSSHSIQASTQATGIPTTQPTQKPTTPTTQTPTTRPTAAPTIPTTQPSTAAPTVTPTTQPSTTAAPVIYYTIRIRSASMRTMGNVRIWIYADESLEQLVYSTATNKNGDAQFQLSYNENYAIVLESADIPEGFRCEPFYRFQGNGCMITLTSAPIAGKDVTQGDFAVGDVIYDFTVTDTDGVTHTLSQILQEKKMVIINFFYINCVPCCSEMPYLMEAYAQYGDDVAILMLDPYPTDNSAKLAAFKESMGLTCTVASVDRGWENLVDNIKGYPTTYVIDRYGVITLKEAGAVDSAEPFLKAMAYFTADNYKEKFCYAGWDSL